MKVSELNYNKVRDWTPRDQRKGRD